MRRHIAKNMQTRSRAIRNAIVAYNAAATALDPPRPKLDWETISHYQFLEDFDLMNETRTSIREKKWAEPAVRETQRLARRLAGAREEIIQVNVEARRVHTAIYDEEKLFASTLARLSNANDDLQGAVLEHVTRRRAANAHVLGYLKKLYQLPQFSGNPGPGVRAGTTSDTPAMNDILDAEGEGTADDDEEGEDRLGDDNEDEDVQNQITALTDFVGGLTL